MGQSLLSQEVARAHKEVRTIPELLAPAGGWEQLRYAIRFGADAVYLAADRFGMRARASNFPLEEIPAVVTYAHSQGVAVHVTLNVQMYQRDLEALVEYLRALADAGVDAFIVGDLGAMRLARKYAPEVEVHVSTQASISNVESALTWMELGAKRIVCAREMSLADIAAMRKELPRELQIEAFAHGAMCMAVSGRCLISDYMTGRSGVAGNCTQPCRWKYDLVEEKRPDARFGIEEDAHGTYIMNAKDLNMLAHVHELAQVGVDSIKIEGRNKKAFYVATVINAYRQVLDGDRASVWEEELDTVSHRPYSTGFYFGPAHQSPETDAYVRPYDWVFEVLSSTPEDNAWRVKGLLRNRFSEGMTLEVLSPHEPIRSFVPEDIHRIRGIGASETDSARDSGRKHVVEEALSRCSFSEGDMPRTPAEKLVASGLVESAYQEPEVLEVANRIMDVYSMRIPFEVHAHDIIRAARESLETKDSPIDKA